MKQGTMRYLMSGQILSMFLGFTLLSFSLGCGYFDSYQRAKQVRTFADLQTIVSIVEERDDRQETLTASTIEAAISEVNRGQDAWGNSFEYEVFTEGGETSYIVLSYGRDGHLDVQDVRTYAHSEPELVAGSFSRDIVFYNGQPVRNAGK